MKQNTAIVDKNTPSSTGIIAQETTTHRRLAMAKSTNIKPGPESELALRKKRGDFGPYIKRYWQLYALLALPLLYLLVFKYLPMVYIQIAFKKYKLNMSVWEMPLAKNYGFEFFIKAFKNKAEIVVINIYFSKFHSFFPPNTSQSLCDCVFL